METLLSPIIYLLKSILMAYHQAFGGFAVPLLLLSATTSICMIPFERFGSRISKKEKDIQSVLESLPDSIVPFYMYGLPSSIMFRKKIEKE